jgi:hypothetical protein
LAAKQRRKARIAIENFSLSLAIEMLKILDGWLSSERVKPQAGHTKRTRQGFKNPNATAAMSNDRIQCRQLSDWPSFLIDTVDITIELHSSLSENTTNSSCPTGQKTTVIEFNSLRAWEM